MKELIAKILYRVGFQYKTSTGICGNTTHGYGKLDYNGYWQYPLYIIDSTDDPDLEVCENCGIAGGDCLC